MSAESMAGTKKESEVDQNRLVLGCDLDNGQL